MGLSVSEAKWKKKERPMGPFSLLWEVGTLGEQQA